MPSFYLMVVVGIVLLSLPYLGRVMVGPTVFDRIIGLNGIGTKVPLLLLFIVELTYGHADMAVDMVLTLFLLNMVVTLLVAKYVLEKGKV